MSEQPTLQAVVFDVDGLIANTEDLYQIAIDGMHARRGKSHDHALRVQMMGRPVLDSLRVMIEYHQLPDPLDDLAEEIKREINQLIAAQLEPMPGFLDLLAALDRHGLPAAVATSGVREYAENVLTRLGVQERFQFILTAENIHRGKPDPEIYLLAASRLHLAPSAMMVLEDSGNGCRAAVAAGAYAVAVPNRHTQEHNFTGTRFVADSLADPRIRHALGI